VGEHDPKGADSDDQQGEHGDEEHENAALLRY
jgi:hypothetical protein